MANRYRILTEGDILTGADASKSAAKAGRLYLPSDGIYIRRDTGAAFANWGPIYPCTEPVLGDFAWVNQGSATATAAYGGIYLATPALNSNSVKILKKAVGSTLTVAVRPNIITANYSLIGLCFRQSSDGKLHVWAIGYNSSELYLVSDKYTSATSYSANYSRTMIRYIPQTLWLRIADTGVNRVCSVSFDGITFHTVHTVGRTDTLTADEWGLCIESNNATYGAAAHYFHCIQT